MTTRFTFESGLLCVTTLRRLRACGFGFDELFDAVDDVADGFERA